MQRTLNDDKIINAKPFLKWAGGKTQLLEELNKRLPTEIIEKGKIKNYVEPFVGGGAFFFYLKKNYVVKKSVLLDINPELIVGYTTIQKEPKKLVDKLSCLESEYLKENERREKLFYDIRALFNDQGKSFDNNEYNDEWVTRTSYLIFLNKTCFNGLFRQNSKGEFNVPFGDYKNPKICDEMNIYEVNKALKNTNIILGDFYKSNRYIKKGTLVYLDPPYRPLNATSSFTGYAKNGFTDDDQVRLSEYYERNDEKGAYLILSNSDPKNENPNDDFFERLYSKYHIERVLASRMINCVAEKRGNINELIIINYKN
jgi:DNA adenine methylase